MSELQPQLGADAFVGEVLGEVANRSPDRVFVEVSGGHDSTALLYAVAHSDEVDIDAVVHLNTGIGAEYTRQYVRQQCARLNLPLVEGIQPNRDERYGQKVIVYGAPGARPIAHEMHRRDLKQDVEDAILRAFDGRLCVITGVSRYESPRRHRTVAQSGLQESERHRNTFYAAPFAELTGAEIQQYLADYDVERNEFADLLDSSGECLCASFDSFYALGAIWQYEPLLVIAILHLMELARQYWVAYREEHGRPPYPRQYLVWGHGGVRDGVLSEMVEGSLDDPDDFGTSDVQERAESAERDDDQLDLSDKCASCNYGPEVSI